MSKNQAYPSDLSDKEWAVIEPLLPQQRTGRPRKYSQREMLNALLYLLRSGCAWRMLPHDLPPWQAVYAYFRKLENEGAWIRLNDSLRERERLRQGREAEPSTLAADSQSVKTTEKGGRAVLTVTKRSKVANAQSSLMS
jgi:transposase